MPMSRRARVRAACVTLALAFVLAACDRKPRAVPMAPAPAMAAPGGARFAAAKTAGLADKSWFTEGAAAGAALNLAYTHEVGLQVASGAIAAHFNAARDRCLNTPGLHCILLRADFGTSPADGPDATTPPQHQGSLSLRLPHDQIAAYAASLTNPLPGEAAGLVTVTHQTMSAEDLSQPVADIGQRVAQLQSYLASLKSLGERLTIGVGDLVKIAGETAQTQTEIEAAQAEQRNLALRVTTETLDIDFTEPAPPAPKPDPIAETWAAARDIFALNVANALSVAIAAIPWIPLAIFGLILLWIIRMLLFGARRR
jgi:hypothetical protein